MKKKFSFLISKEIEEHLQSLKEKKLIFKKKILEIIKLINKTLDLNIKILVIC